MTRTRSVPQLFWRDEQLPWLELRNIWQNQQAYKRRHHPRLSTRAILEGKTCYLCGGEKYRLQVGDLIIIPPLAPHSCSPVNEQFHSYRMLYLDAQWYLADLPAQSISQRPCTPTPVIRDARLFQRYIHLVTLMPQCQVAQVTSTVQALLHTLSLQSITQDNLNATGQCLRKQLQSSLLVPPSLNELARECHIRGETPIRTLKQDTGLTLGSYLNIIRIDHAHQRLWARDKIADVGYQSGFTDQNHFHRTFIHYAVATPCQYTLG